MSEGDITRLNRMYRCKEFKEDEDYDFFEADPTNDSTYKESNIEELVEEKESNVEVTKESSPPTDDSADVSGIVRYLKETVMNMFSAIQPLCTLQTKLIKIWRRIQRM